MSRVSGLAAFMRDRLDEDEAAAKACRSPSPWKAADHDADTWIVTDATGEVLIYDEGTPTLAEAAHIARHDPARVLREVEAGRARVALMIEATADMDRLLADENAAVADQAMAVGRARAATVAVKWDAIVHIAHPDYMLEWKPPVPVTA